MAPSVGNANTASYLKGNAEINTIKSNGNSTILFKNDISGSNFIGTASVANNLPLLPGSAAYNFTSSWAKNSLNSNTSSVSKNLIYDGVNANGTASYALNAKNADTASYIQGAVQSIGTCVFVGYNTSNAVVKLAGNLTLTTSWASTNRYIYHNLNTTKYFVTIVPIGAYNSSSDRFGIQTLSSNYFIISTYNSSDVFYFQIWTYQ